MKKIIFSLLYLFLSISVAQAGLLEKVSCDTYGSDANSCSECFDGGHVYEGKGKFPYDIFNNNGNNKNVYFDDENTVVYETSVLQNTTTWFTSNNLLKYTDDFNWYTSKSGRFYHIFESNTSTRFLETVDNRGIRLNEVRDGTNRNKPAYRFKFKSNYHIYDWNLGPKIEHTECVFYKPAYCGDGVIDSSVGEKCDDGNTNNDDSCNNSCQIVTSETYDLALVKKVSGTTTTFSKDDSVTFDITVYNQGNVDANNIIVTDYIPTGLTLNDSAWTLSGNIATRNVGSIVARQSKTVSIKFTITGDSGDIINWAEISSDDGDDIDSTPDSNNNNDCHGGDDRNFIDVNSDDRITGIGDSDKDGVCKEGEDEDDHDPTKITVIGPSIKIEKYSGNDDDLDGTKTHVAADDTQTVNYSSGAVFGITVTNIGTENLKTVTLTDALASNCDRTDIQTKAILKTIGNNDEIFNVGETFTYTCSKANTQADYTNSIIVNGVGVTSNINVLDDDTTSIIVTNSPSTCEATITGTQNSSVTNTTTGLCKNAGEIVENFIATQNGNTTNYVWSCKDPSTNELKTGGNCNATYTAVYGPRRGGGHSGNTYRCNDAIVTGNTVKCIGNSRAKTFGIICDSDSGTTADKIEQFKVFSKDINNNNYASFDCTTVNKPICFVYNNRNQLSYGNKAWRTSPACSNTDPFCGNGKIETGEECEAPVDDKGIVGDLPSFCDNTCKINSFEILPINNGNPNEGEIGFVGMHDMVIGHNQNLSKLNNEIYIWNNSDYTFDNSVFNGICITKNNVAGQENIGDSISNVGLNRHCTDITSKFYPGQKKYLRKDLSDIKADKTKVDGDNYEDNNLVVTIKTTKNTNPNAKILNWSDHLTGKFKVRVAKPAVQTTGGTSFTKAGISANSNKIAEEKGINLDGGTTNDGKNNNDVGVGTKSSSANTTTDTKIVEDATKYQNESSAIDNNLASDSNVTNLGDITDKYNGLDNVFILKNANVNLSDTDLTLSEPTTYIIDGGDLNINSNIKANKNIAFVVKNGGNINIGASVTEITGTYIVLGSGKITGNESPEQLTIKGSLYGNITNLVDNRYKVTENNGELTFGTVVSFGSTIFQKPAPMVTQFVNTYLKTSKVAK